MASTAIQTVMDALIEKFGDTDGNINVPQDALVKALKSMKTDGHRGRKTRAPRDPDAPKRPTSSYMLWLNDNRQSIANTHFPAELTRISNDQKGLILGIYESIGSLARIIGPLVIYLFLYKYIDSLYLILGIGLATYSIIFIVLTKVSKKPNQL